MEQQTFKPQLLGFNEKYNTEALRAWEHLIDVTNDLLADVVSFLKRENITTEQFIHLLSLSPDEAMVKIYESAGLSIPGMNTKKLIELGIASNEYSTTIEKGFKLFQNANEKAQRLFKYELSLLRDSEGLFYINDVFEEKLKEFCTLYTTSEKENEALIHLQQIISGFNYFAKIGMINPSHGPKSFDPVLWGIQTKKGHNEFETKLNPFRMPRWNSFFC